MLEKEMKYYIAHQSEFNQKYNGKYIVIIGESVVGEYSDENEAYRKTLQKHELGTFIIQYCSTNSNNHTQTFHSRVIFA